MAFPKSAQLLLLVLFGGLLMGSDAHLSTVAGQSRMSASTLHSLGQGTGQPEDVHAWFAEYDDIRRHARMSFMEKIQSRHLIMFAFNPMAFFANEARPLLTKMIVKYKRAIEQMEELDTLAETAELQEGYLKYFRDAKQLFVDLCDAQDESPEERRKILPKLVSRKKDLEELDQKNKQLDARLRLKYDIPPLRG